MNLKTLSRFGNLIALLCAGVAAQSVPVNAKIDIGEQHNRALTYLDATMEGNDDIDEAHSRVAEYLTDEGVCDEIFCSEIASGMTDFYVQMGIISDGDLLPEEQRIPVALEELVANGYMNTNLADGILSFYQRFIIVEDEVMFIVIEDDLMFLYYLVKSELEKDAVDAFIDVFLHSQMYWTTEEGSGRRLRKWFRVFFADAMGALHGAFWGGVFSGGNPIGIGAGAVVGGAAMSHYANKHDMPGDR